MSERVNPTLISPLRYPGGKGALAPFLGRIIGLQSEAMDTYVEPFAGGAGAALRLLYDEYIERIMLNDIDPGVFAMWRSIVFRTDEFVDRILTEPINIDRWREMREIHRNPENTEELELGFATFFLNRTNRSGILNANPIGGLEQTGRWKIDARFPRSDLAARIRLIGTYRNRIVIEGRDGIEICKEYLPRSRTFLYVDPPYLNKGGGLYFDTLTWADHQELAQVLRRNRGCQWLLTYDHDERVPELYSGLRCADFNIAHTAARQHVGQEYAVFSDGLRIDNLMGLSSPSAVG